jgi:twitching motility protein PilT
MEMLARELYNLLELAVEREASDLHLKVASFPVLRINGELIPLTDRHKITAAETEDLARQIMTERQLTYFDEHKEIDMAHSVPGVGRFRVNVFTQRGSVGMVFRVIPTEVRTIRELNLPRVIESLALLPRGLILCTGTTGSGKSTTLAAMIRHINENRNVHVMTIEDPIEYLHQDKLSMINQREVGSDTNSFVVALRAALRQDPDVILVGEMRDPPTVETALMAAETGHLVLSTLHTTDAIETILRVISFYPPEQHRYARLTLAACMKAVISQRLIVRADGKGRVPAVEVMINTPIIRECIIQPERTKYILDVMRQGVSQYGMQTFDQSLYYLVKQELVTYQEALQWATNPDDFALRFKGIESAADQALADMESSLADSYRYDERGDSTLERLIDRDNQIRD